jgi:hypothetical protein
MMKVAKWIAAVAFGIAATGAFAETGVNIGDVGYVANVYGRAGVSNVSIAGPLVTRPAEVTAAGRELAQGVTPVAVKVKDLDVNDVFGRA